MSEERRNKTRVQFETRVVVRTGDTVVTSRAGSRDISLRGLYIETDRELLQGTSCEVEILLTGTSSKLAIKAQGRVARRGPKGLGIEFESIDPDSYFHLRNLLLYNTEDPALVEQEEHL